MDRRSLLGAIVSVPIAAACRTEPRPVRQRIKERDEIDAVESIERLGFQWKTRDPFLFCVHHDDAYPAGNDQLGPAAALDGRELGRDFAEHNAWRMYHGEVVPGFPQHPHRGFETVTIVRRGLVDHADSLGAAARYGQGDVQWLTAGKGIVHAEMFPLLDRSAPNPLDLFQIWLNLPSTDKFVDPHFSMLWKDMIPKHVARDANGKATDVTVIAGRIGDSSGKPPPPKSYAARSASEVAIWTIRMDAGARFVLPKAAAGVHRTLYFFRGQNLRIGSRDVTTRHAIELRADVSAVLQNGVVESELLLLQGRPIAEPVAQRGPFVMNTDTEIRQAFTDYRQTGFGGWPWPSHAPVHGVRPERFARHADGRIERSG